MARDKLCVSNMQPSFSPSLAYSLSLGVTQTQFIVKTVFVHDMCHVCCRMGRGQRASQGRWRGPNPPKPGTARGPPARRTRSQPLVSQEDRLAQLEAENEELKAQVKLLLANSKPSKKRVASDSEISEDERPKPRKRQRKQKRRQERSESESSDAEDLPKRAHPLVEAADDAVEELGRRVAGNDIFRPAGLPLDLHVSDKVKAQIRAGKYIDFYLLLDKEEPQLSLGFKVVDGVQHLVAGPPSMAKKPLSWDQWTTTWNIFQAIYVSAHPSTSSLLAEHLEVVKELYKDGKGWRYYDANFRRLIEKGMAQWGFMHGPLHDKARTRSEAGPSGGSTAQQAGRSDTTFPAGACKNYQASGFCKFGKNCKYQHSCCNCLGPHPYVNCTVPLSGSFKILPRFRSFRNSKANNQQFNAKKGGANPNTSASSANSSAQKHK